MNVNYLTEFINPIVMGICLCSGYAIKTAFEKIPNKYIPLCMLVLGTVLSCVISLKFDAVTILSGMISGLASTGCYELLKNLINGGK